MKDFYSVKELAALCSVSEQAIRAYLARNGCAKVASQWKPTQDELRELFRHYGVDIAQVEQVAQEFASNQENNTTQVAQTTQRDKTPGETAILLDFIAELKKQIEVKDEQLKNAAIEIQQLQEDSAKKSEQISELIKTNNNLSLPQATRALSDAHEIMSIEPIQETKEKDGAADATPQPTMTNDEWANLGTWERIKRAWKGVLNG